MVRRAIIYNNDITNLLLIIAIIFIMNNINNNIYASIAVCICFCRRINAGV